MINTMQKIIIIAILSLNLKSKIRILHFY